MVAKCQLCHKKTDLRLQECDESGLSWHCYCFRCYVCGVLLNEKYMHIRGDKNELFCGSHVVHQKGTQPTCKIYCVDTIYRVVF